MNTFAIRPPVADLRFQLFGRPLHPELFDIRSVQRYERDDYQLRVWITRTGHVLTWRNPHVLLTEAADVGTGHSEARRLLSYRLRGEHAATLDVGRGITYQTSFHVETLAPDIFQHVHEEILADGRKRGYLHNFQPNHRLAIAPLSHVIVEARRHCLLVSAFHTFPEEHAVVKSQSLIERR